MIGKLLGIDHGLKRIGLAVSDALGISSRPLTVLDNTDFDTVAAALQQHIDQQQIAAVVVGVPTNERSTEQADIVQEWVAKLQPGLPCPVVLWDEQLTSADAKALAKQLKRPPQDPIDDLAASVMLQSYLNALADGLATPPGKR